VATAYPGTPSTEITESIAKYDEVYCEWSPNEKVALEVAIGSAIAGGRAICSMKHVGLNVAADLCSPYPTPELMQDWLSWLRMIRECIALKTNRTAECMQKLQKCPWLSCRQ